MTSKVYNQHDAIIFNVDTKTPEGKRSSTKFRYFLYRLEAR